MRALWLMIRSSPARHTAIPLSVLGGAMLFVRTDYWIGIWPEAGAAVGVTSYFTGMFAAGVAGWTAASTARRGMDEQIAAARLPQPLVEGTRFLATLLWLTVPFAVVAASAAIATVNETGFPAGIGMFTAYVALGFVLLVLSTAWGWLIGRLLPPLVAAMAALLSWFMVSLLLVELTETSPMSGPPWIEVDVWVIAIRLTAALAFAAAVCALPRQVSRSAAAMGALMASLIAVATTHVATQPLEDREVPPDSSLVCVQVEIEYCLWPEHEKYTSLVETVDERVAELPEFIALPERMVDYSLSGSRKYYNTYRSEADPNREFDPEFDISEGHASALAMGVSMAIEDAVFEDCSDDRFDDPALGPELDQFRAWLEYRLTGHGPDYATTAPQEMQDNWEIGREIAATWTESEQADWASALIDRVRSEHC